MQSQYAPAVAITLHGQWRASSASNAGYRSHCSPWNHGCPLSSHQNLPALAQRFASNPLRTSSGCTSEGTFCPSNCVLYEVLVGVSAAGNFLSQSHLHSNHLELVMTLPSRSIFPRRIRVDEIGRLSSAKIKSMGAIINGFSPLVFLILLIM